MAKEIDVKVLVLGQGGREHAILWKLQQSRRVKQIFCAPGNAGTEQIAKNLSWDGQLEKFIKLPFQCSLSDQA